MSMNRQYVSVESMNYADGSIRPLKIFWEDGRTWNIKRVLHMAEPAADEFEGIRYTVLIGSAEKYIYRLGSAWYVNVPAGPQHMEVDTS